MDELNLDAMAEEAASKYAPRPKTEPVVGGLMGAVIVGMAVGVFAGLEGLKSDGIPGSLVVVMGLGFAVPYFFLWYQMRSHSKAWLQEYERLKKVIAPLIDLKPNSTLHRPPHSVLAVVIYRRPVSVPMKAVKLALTGTQTGHIVRLRYSGGTVKGAIWSVSVPRFVFGLCRRLP